MTANGGAGETTGLAPDSQAAMPVGQGEVIGERYRVLHELGRGGMGVVVAAEHLQLPQRVAIKFLLEAVNPATRLRFMREAETVVQLRSEHVRRVLDVGALPSGEPYMVMELLEGQDLQQVFVQRGPLPVGEVVDYALQTCEALAEAHRMGVVHRDLKPSNLFLSQSVDGSAVIKVLDFGIAKAGAPVSGPQELTQSGVAMGSPRFMAPEQLVSSRDVDARADIWALGVTLYELLAGQPAFPGQTAAELHVAILQQHPRRLTEVRPDVPPSVAQAIERCLRKEPERRWRNVAELARALEPAAPPHAQRYVERIQRMVGTTGAPPSPAVVHAPGGLAADPHLAGAPTTPAPEGLAPAPTLGPDARGPKAGGGAQPLGPGGSTTSPQVMGAAATTTTSAGEQQRRMGLFLGLGIGGVATALAVVGVVFAMRGGGASAEDGRPCYFEKCDDSASVRLNQPLEPERFIEPTTALARSLEPDAQLASISFSGLRGGAFQRQSEANLTFNFSFGTKGEGEGMLFVVVNTEQMMARYIDRGALFPAVAPPSCPFREAFRAAKEDVDFPDDQAVVASYSMYSSEPAWVITTARGTPHRVVDGRCRVSDVIKGAEP